ncbi:MAG: chromate transporter [Christensenella sp.]|nr:chromate transporter [Christensenella sp.]
MKTKTNQNILWKLFTSTMLISAFTFGGGYVIVPLMKKKFVDELQWLEEEETLDFVAIAQSSPGAVAVNAAILLGYRIAGFPGALVAILGTILPPMVILSILSFFYIEFKENPAVNAALGAMRAGVAAVIVSVVFGMGRKILQEKDFVSVFVMLIAFVAVYFFKVNIVLVILLCAMIGITRIYWKLRKEANDDLS